MTPTQQALALDALRQWHIKEAERFEPFGGKNAVTVFHHDCAETLREVIASLEAVTAAVAEPAEPMHAWLCERHSYVLRVGQPYVFQPAEGCDSCAAMAEQAREAYGPSMGAPESTPPPTEPSAEVVIPEPDVLSYTVDSVMRRYELHTHSNRQLRAYGDARAAAAILADRAARVPLTDEQIDRTWNGMGSFTERYADWRIFARAIERTHGITPTAPTQTGATGAPKAGAE